ncbi:DUF4760 domain-containing protein [Streptomyces muensis]|uniref:DUF4760 domain-containing protein n=1 Tax=Streptomyces muensis TaxID=1077944 RepID=A0A9X1Q5J0_STRM4|nr:hypothetical protein [Streptomyces muensis]MCF1599520.1 hypothetical protein [Streptomyces muensis]
MTTLLGVLAGGVVSWLAGVRRDRLTMAFEMHRELHSTELLQARYKAGVAVRKNQTQSYLDLEQELGPEAAHDLRLILHFFERLWLAIEHRAIAERYVPRLFGDTFYWWYAASFRHQFVPLGSEVGRNIQQLWGWLERESSSEQLEKWRSGNEKWLPARPSADAPSTDAKRAGQGED